MRNIVCALVIMTVQIFVVNCVEAQNFIGMDKEDIKEEMNTRFKNFRLNTSTVNHAYNYLKYEDNINEITILFFLSSDDKCKLVRKMYDYSNINDVVKELNSSYKAKGKDHWIYMDKGKEYDVDLTEGDWFFTVTIKPKD